MRKCILFIVLIFVSLVHAKHPNGKAMTTIHVVDVKGEPVSGAKVYGSFRYSYTYEDVDRFSEMTSTNGVVIFSGKLGPELNISVYKEGWYKSSKVIHWQTYFSDAEIKDGKWQPWNPTVEIVLKKKKNPIPLICRNIDEAVLPVENEPVGFDLFEGDWVQPYGKGKIADLIITAENDYRGFRDLDVKYSILFSNMKDGLIRFESPKKYGSKLISNQEAPEFGYENTFSAYYGRTGNKVFGKYDAKNVNYYFRIRTKVDEQGNIINAHYGKIYRGIVMGPWDRDGLRLSLLYYLNPTSLNRNVEYDTKTNLAIPSGLSPMERRDPLYSVNQP